MRHLARTAALLLVGLAVACSGPQTSTPDPNAVLRQAGQTMAALHSVGADAKFGSGISYQGLTLSSASTSIQVPDQSDTLLKVKQGDFLVDVRLVTTNGHTYLRLPFSQFTEVTADQARELPDMAQLLDQRSGLPTLLTAGKDTKYEGTEQIGGADMDKVATTYTAEQVGQLLGGAARPAGDIQATIWAGRTDHYVHRVILSGPLLEAGKNAQVQVDFRDFNKPVTIANPIQT